MKMVLFCCYMDLCCRLTDKTKLFVHLNAMYLNKKNIKCTSKVSHNSW